jgi:hypothetical protein
VGYASAQLTAVARCRLACALVQQTSNAAHPKVRYPSLLQTEKTENRIEAVRNYKRDDYSNLPLNLAEFTPPFEGLFYAGIQREMRAVASSRPVLVWDFP